MAEKEKKQGIIKKLNMIYRNGYVPSRDMSKYCHKFTTVVNCFGHACFNLTDEELEKFSHNKKDLLEFFRHFGSVGIYNIFREAKNRVREVGLKIEECTVKDKMQKNQWKVACFVQNDEFAGTDLHFMLQGKDGKWTSKMGTNPEVEVLDKLPKTFRENYKLAGIYKITNPYVKLEDTEGMEM